MLVRLFGRNFRSLKNPFELSLVAADFKRAADRDRGVIKVRIEGMQEPLPLLRSLAIYGPNASGKSTILMASRALRWLALESSARSKPDADIPTYEPFLLDDESGKNSVELGCDVVLKKSILRYEIEFKQTAILREKLALLTGDSETPLIDRRLSGEVRGELIDISDANRLYVKGMQPNVAVLAKLAQHGPQRGEESVQPYYRAIRNATRYANYSGATIEGIGLGAERFADDPAYRDWVMEHLIRPADVGICGAETRREALEFPAALRELAKIDSDIRLPDQRVVVSFLHEGATNRLIDFSYQSSGTKKLFNMGGEWWALATEPITLFADELSASLHPKLLDRIIRSVNDPEVSTVRSQLIFATHDTGLLEGQDGLPPALRRDQVYFTKKDRLGMTEVYSLVEFKEDARPVHNIRKRYLSGLYGAIPEAEKVSL